MDPLLRIEGLRTHFFTDHGTVRAVDGVDLTVSAGEILGLVGESGCGKTMTALSILRLIDPPGRIVDGRINFAGRDLLPLPPRAMTAIRGSEIAMIFQQPKVSLNPVQRAGDQIAEQFIRHRGMGKRAALAEAIALLAAVGIPAPEAKARAYPHELSGGQAQRVGIAIALALRPQLIIADEPTTAVDVTVQAQILSLLRDRCRERGTALILVTHDLGVIAQLADRVAVMYAGQIVEQGATAALFANPAHPYTAGLLGSIPRLGALRPRLAEIAGTVPLGFVAAPGCRFASRCTARIRHNLARCTVEMPPLTPRNDRQDARCWLPHDEVAA